MGDDDYKALVARLRGKMLNCDCGAHSWSECCCDTEWPESSCEPAADAIEALMEELDAYKMDGSAASMAIKAAEARAERAEAALRFYANPTGEVPDFYSELDFGERAHAVLAQIEKETNE